MADQRTAQFWEAAIRMTAEIGLENIRTKNIAQMCECSEATLYHYFESKDELLRSTFLEVDHRVSRILMERAEDIRKQTPDIQEAFHRIWSEAYRYLLEHRDEALFLLRFRYSSLYNEDIRSQRQAYNGSFNRYYQVMEEVLGTHSATYRGFLLNYIFEMTLCFAEKVIMGRVPDAFETERRLWAAIKGAVENIIAPDSGTEE